MKIVVAMMKHETNTFSPVPTPLSRFAIDGERPYRGRDVYSAFKGTGSALAGFIDVAEAAGAELVTPIAASASPSGRVSREAFDFIAESICEAVRNGCDAVLLDLHGAMVTEDHEDGEGELLRRLRAIDGTVPIGVALDMHTNLFGDLVDLSTVIAGYQTYPHVDMRHTGAKVASQLLATLRGDVRPAMAWGNVPMLPHIMRQGTHASPNREIQARAKAMEASGEALLATVLTGFPHADVSQAGTSAVVVTDGDQTKAQLLRDELLQMCWEGRHGFVYEIEPVGKSLARARELADAPGTGPVILLDHFDNCGSGGTMDTTDVLRAVIEAGLDDVVAFAIHDPEAVAAMAALGEGSEISLDIGGRSAMPALGRSNQPLCVSGKIVKISDGKYRNRGPMESGVLMDMGPTAVLDTGKVQIVVISRHVEPFDVECLISLGIDPSRKRFVMLKSRVHFRAGFQDMAREIVDCAGLGVCTSDYGELTFQNVRRPIYPLDADVRLGAEN